MQKNHPQALVFGLNWTARLLMAAAFVLVLVLFTQPVRAFDNKAQKEWTFLLFLNGHNNLDSFGEYNINQMEEVGSTDQLNMVVQWASLENGQTRRLLVQKDNDKNTVTSPAVESLAPVDMGDYKQLIEFIRWGVQNYPAKKYMIAVWNHGNGWYRLNQGQTPRDISYDDLTGNQITTEQLGLAMAEAAKIIGHKVDIYGSDACLMAMGEVAAEMKNSVSYMVASQEVEPGYGWPYSTWMRKWAANKTATAAEVSVYLTTEYLNAYNGGIYGKRDVTFSAMDISKLDGLLQSVNKLNSSLVNLNAAEMKAVKSAAHSVQYFTYDDYRDLGQFSAKLANANVSINSSVFAEVKNSIEQVVVANGGTGTYKNVSGISVWLPVSVADLNSHQNRYSKLSFNQSTQWLNFLQRLNQ